jgi:hypothetical protein
MAKISGLRQYGYKPRIKRKKRQNPRRIKRISTAQLVDDLKGFADEFKEFQKESTLHTPQADRGIGPVKYDIKFHAGLAVKQTALTMLDKLIKLEKSLGDLLLKLDLSIVCIAYKREDPEKWIPAAFRVGIRIEINK